MSFLLKENTETLEAIKRDLLRHGTLKAKAQAAEIDQKIRKAKIKNWFLDFAEIIVNIIGWVLIIIGALAMVGGFHEFDILLIVLAGVVIYAGSWIRRLTTL